MTLGNMQPVLCTWSYACLLTWKQVEESILQSLSQCWLILCSVMIRSLKQFLFILVQMCSLLWESVTGVSNWILEPFGILFSFLNKDKPPQLEAWSVSIQSLSCEFLNIIFNVFKSQEVYFYKLPFLSLFIIPVI